MPEPAAHPWVRNAADPIVITGHAAVGSLGITADSIWQNVLAKRCGIGPMPDLESTLPPECTGGQAAPLPSSYCPDLPREARYLRWTVEHALRDADAHALPAGTSHRRSVLLGTTLHGIRAGGRCLRTGDMNELRAFPASSTADIALRGLHLQGGAITTCSACSSSLGAITLGITLLQTGQADLVIAGGYDAISEYAWAGFNALRLVSPGDLRPFCKGRQGMKVAEGYGIVVLERQSSAIARKGPIRAIIAGWGESADSHHLTQPHPQGEGALAAMREALSRANLRPANLSMVAAHATGTPDNDAAEFQALSRLLGDQLTNVPVVGFKSFLGHTLGGAGALELVLSCMALRDQRAPACPNVYAADIEYAGLLVPADAPLERDLACTLNTSLGFGGANTCVILANPRAPLVPADSRNPDSASPSDAASVADPEPWITGLGIVLPGAIGAAAFAAMLAAHETPHTPPDHLTSLDDASLAEHLNVRRARRLSQYVKLTLAAATMAVRDAALADRPDLLAGACGILGSMHGSASFCFEYYSQIVKEGVLTANPVLFAEGVPNAAAAHLSTTFGLKGSCQTIIGSRTSGLDALALAALRIRSGVADRILVVAAEARCDFIDRAYAALAHPASATVGGAAPIRHTPAGEGAIAFIVESNRSAQARGVLPYARIAQSAWASSSADARSFTISPSVSAAAAAAARLADPGRIVTSPRGTSAQRAESLGLRRAGLVSRAPQARLPFGELFSVASLVSIAQQIVAPVQPQDGPFSVVSADSSGAATAVTLQPLTRSGGSSPRSTLQSSEMHS